MKRIPLLLLFLVVATPAWAAGDVGRGQAVFTRCVGCHALSGASGTGPSLHGLFGRHAGSAPGFNFSKAMVNSGIVWDEATLKKFLADPDAAVPGTKMQTGAVSDPQQADDVIAYLQSATR